MFLPGILPELLITHSASHWVTISCSIYMTDSPLLIVHYCFLNLVLSKTMLLFNIFNPVAIWAYSLQTFHHSHSLNSISLQNGIIYNKKNGGGDKAVKNAKTHCISNSSTMKTNKKNNNRLHNCLRESCLIRFYTVCIWSYIRWTLNIHLFCYKSSTLPVFPTKNCNNRLQIIYSRNLC